MAHTFDATLKDLLSPAPEDFASVFALPSGLPATVLNVDLSTLSAATDVAFGFGEPLREIVDINFQSGPDSDIDARCHLYSAALHFRFGVPVRTILLLLRPKADSGTISGSMSYASRSSGVEFRYEVTRIWEQMPETYLGGGVSLLPLATLCRLPPGRPVAIALRDVVQEIERRLAEECEHAEAARIMTAAFVLAGLRVDRKELGPIFDGVKIMHESSAYDLILEEGGVREAQRIILRLGKRRFGNPDEATIKELSSIKDLDRLERLTDEILGASNWNELIATP
jgi:hypothetical protein